MVITIKTSERVDISPAKVDYKEGSFLQCVGIILKVQLTDYQLVELIRELCDWAGTERILEILEQEKG